MKTPRWNCATACLTPTGISANAQGGLQYIPSSEIDNVAQRLALATGNSDVGQDAEQNESLRPLGAQLQSNNVLHGLPLHF